MDNTSQTSAVRMIDIVFPNDANHHGTLFGGAALSYMDKAAFLAASRHGRVPFVTASSEKIDFSRPAYIGDMVETTGRVVRVGNSSLDVEVELKAEQPVTGEQRLCTLGKFTLVAVKGEGVRLPLPPLVELAESEFESDALGMVDVLFPTQTNHFGTLYGGDALKMMGKAAFIAATKRSRRNVVMAASDRIDFVSPINQGDMIELSARILMTGRTSLRVEVQLWSEELLSGARKRAATGVFTMVCIGSDGRPCPIERSADEAVRP